MIEEVEVNYNNKLMENEHKFKFLNKKVDPVFAKIDVMNKSFQHILGLEDKI